MFRIIFTYIRIAWSWQDLCACAVVLAVMTDTVSVTAKGDDDFALTPSSPILINIGCWNVQKSICCDVCQLSHLLCGINSSVFEVVSNVLFVHGHPVTTVAVILCFLIVVNLI